ncbi:MAG: DNA gyrase subunit A [Nitrospirota bacterium]
MSGMTLLGASAPIDLLDGCTPETRRLLHVVHELVDEPHDRIDAKRVVTVFCTRELGLDPDDVEAACDDVSAHVRQEYLPGTVGHVYRTLLRLTQPWRARYPLLDAAGMIGDHHDDDPGGPDLVSVSASKVSDTVLPLDRPPLLPLGLLNGRLDGAPMIPSHNLSELWTAMEHVRQDPDESLDDLMAVMPGPDFPSGGVIWGVEAVRRLYETGAETLVLRADIDEELQGFRTRVAITSLPPGVLIAAVLGQIRDLAKRGRLTLTQLEDQSTPDRVRIVVDAPGAVTTERLKATLFADTDCERRVPCRLGFGADTGGVTRPLREWLALANQRCSPAWRPKRGPLLDRVPTLREIMERGGYESPLFRVIDRRRTKIVTS